MVCVTTGRIWLIDVSLLAGEGPAGGPDSGQVLGALACPSVTWMVSTLAFDLDGGPLSASCHLSGPLRRGVSGGLLTPSSRSRSADPSQHPSWSCSCNSMILDQGTCSLWASNRQPPSLSPDQAPSPPTSRDNNSRPCACLAALSGPALVLSRPGCLSPWHTPSQGT